MSHKEDGWFRHAKDCLLSQLIWCRKQTCPWEARRQAPFSEWLLLVFVVANLRFAWGVGALVGIAARFEDIRKSREPSPAAALAGRHALLPLWNLPAADWRARVLSFQINIQWLSPPAVFRFIQASPPPPHLRKIRFGSSIYLKTDARPFFWKVVYSSHQWIWGKWKNVDVYVISTKRWPFYPYY